MPPTTPAFPAWQRDFALLTVAGFTAFAFALSSPAVVSDGDTFWHIATGRWILTHHAVPSTDPFSYAAVGRPWVTHEWLSEVIMALAFNALSWAGLRLLTGVAFSLVGILLANRLRKELPLVPAVVVLAFSFFLLSRHVLERPHMIALPILVLWTIELLRARDQSRLPSLWLIPLMTLWANLHGSYVFGIAFSGFFAIEAFLADKGKRVRTGALWGAFIVAAVAAALVTPNGFDGLIYPMKVMAMGHLTAIREWRPVDFSEPSAVPVTFFVAAGACLYLGIRMPLVRAALLLLLVQMTFVHIRQEIVLAVTAPLLMAEPLGQALARRTSLKVLNVTWPSYKELAAPIAVMGMLIVAATVWCFETENAPIDADNLPLAAFEHTPLELRKRPAFNDYAFGGWLILNGASPFIDGRSDMYGDDHLQRYLQLDSAAAVGVDQTFRTYKIAWSILKPKSGLIPALAERGWKTIYADQWAVVQVRPDAIETVTRAPTPSMKAARP